MPLSQKTLTTGEQFGPISFSISPSSHEHHLAYLKACGIDAIEQGQLLPSEYWPLARVLSQWRFGRLNEVIALRAGRTVFVRPLTGETVLATSRVRSVFKRQGLCFGVFDSVVKAECGSLCMLAEDVLLLANGCDPVALRRAIVRTDRTGGMVDADGTLAVIASWRLQLRYPWPDDKWKNNVHTDTYATSLGYRCALVEGPGVMDIVYCHDQERSPANRVRLSWRHVRPLYHGSPIVLLTGNAVSGASRRYYLCEASDELSWRPRLLLSAEVIGI
jgi:hypothetical protein